MLKPWSYKLPALNAVVYEDAQLAPLGVFIGDTPVSYLGSSWKRERYFVSHRKSQACCRFA
jgi:hypothetical protein